MSPSSFDVCIALPPLDPRVDLAGEGLLRVVNHVLSGAIFVHGARFRIVTHAWCEPSVRSAIESHFGVATTAVTVKSITPPVWFRLRSRFYRHLVPFAPAMNRFADSKGRIYGVTILCFFVLLASILFLLARTTGPSMWLTVVLALSSVGLLLFVLFVGPICLRSGARLIYTQGERLERWYNGNRDRLHSQADEKLIRSINSGDARAVWVPLPVKSCSKLSKPWVLTFADWVPGSFPTLFAEHPEYVERQRSLMSMLQQSNAIITFSEWVRDNHLRTLAPNRMSDTVVIPHAQMDLRPQGNLESAIGEDPSISSQLIAAGVDRKVAEWDWASCQFLLAPTQARPHKNLLGLFMALEILNREYFHNLRLCLTTGSLDQTLNGVNLAHWLESRGLEHQVVTVGRLPMPLLCRLMELSSCVISVSLFEASVPFMLSEGTSVGTPVILAANAVTRSELLGISPSESLFCDPLQPKSIAHAVHRSIRHPDFHLQRQRQVVDDYYRGISWIERGREYLSVLESVARGFEEQSKNSPDERE